MTEQLSFTSFLLMAAYYGLLLCIIIAIMFAAVFTIKGLVGGFVFGV